MHCYECARTGRRAATAVALCRACSAALCLEHVRAEAAAAHAGGTTIGCGHDTWSVPATAAAAPTRAEYAAAPAVP